MFFQNKLENREPIIFSPILLLRRDYKKPKPFEAVPTTKWDLKGTTSVQTGAETRGAGRGLAPPKVA
jgi:hypothetical protein